MYGQLLSGSLIQNSEAGSKGAIFGSLSSDTRSLLADRDYFIFFRWPSILFTYSLAASRDI